jgi:hypothetical protein
LTGWRCSWRSTIAQASAARLAAPADRLAHQHLTSATTSLFRAASAGMSTLVLAERADGTLGGMGWLAAASTALSRLPALMLVVLGQHLAGRQGI